MRRDLLEEIQKRIIVFDGGMGISIEELGLVPENPAGPIEALCLTRPDAIEAIHRSFLAAGCDGIETNTLGGSRLKLEEYGLGDRVHEINLAASRIARRTADEFEGRDGRPRFVAGSMGPSGILPSLDGPGGRGVAFGRLREVFCEQARALISGGCDMIMIETSHDLLEARAASLGARDAMGEAGVRLPLVVMVTLGREGRMLLGTEIGAAAVVLEAIGVDVIGVNCSTGPREMADAVRYLSERSSRPISVMPNAGIPENIDGKSRYTLSPGAFAAELARFAAELGVAILGGCCGTRPDHIAALVRAVDGITPRAREVPRVPHAASGITAVSLRQEPRPLLIGERLNAQGSKKARELFLAEAYDRLVAVARKQVAHGAHLLDLSVAMPEPGDEARRMMEAARRLALGTEAPLVIDATDPEVIRSALEVYPGRAVVNSISLERGEAGIHEVMPAIRELGALVVALTIDEQGMARTADRKLEVARRIAATLSRDYGVPPDEMIFDPLTFTLASGDGDLRFSARETIEGVSRIKVGIPGALVLLGISNVSFGLGRAARQILNSVFLHRAVEAGLDVAIVNPGQIVPVASIPQDLRSLADDLLLGRHPEALTAFVNALEPGGPEESDEDGGGPSGEDLSPADAIRHAILTQRAEGIEELVEQAVRDHPPTAILNEILLPSMKDVGDRFATGELILPFVLGSAAVMKRAMGRLEQFLDRAERGKKGTVLLATVFGDIHDIGKNLVRTILANNGYAVIDLGKQVPSGVIIEKAVEAGADAIGLSALLVSTSREMPVVVRELHRAGQAIPVLVGGAAINRSFAHRIALVDGEPYAGGVFYCRDAFAGLEACERIVDPGRREAAIAGTIAKALKAAPASVTVETTPPGRPASPGPRVPLEPGAPGKPDAPAGPPRPPFMGARTLEQIDIRDVFELLDIPSLFKRAQGRRGRRRSPGCRPGPKAGPGSAGALEDLAGRLEALREESIAEGYLSPRAVYGYFEARPDGDAVRVLAADDPQANGAVFIFPRIRGTSLADHLRSDRAALALQVVTVGPRASQIIEEWDRAGEYARSYLMHALAAEAAEALAEYCHRHIRKEVGLRPDEGRRRSPGYPSWPRLEDHREIFRLLDAERAIGVSLTAGAQIVPEQSTAAVVLLG